MRNGRAELCALVSLVMMSLPVAAIDRQQPTRTNPLVFNFFKQQLIESNVHEDVHGRVRADIDPAILNTFAYSLTRDFCLQVDKKLDDLEQGFMQVQSARSEALGDSGQAGQGAQARWSESLRRVASTARKLHSMLRLILADVRHEDSSAPASSSSHSDPAFEYETKAMGDQILRVDERIKGFLSGETVTISVEELRSGDILILLSRVQAEAGEMGERLDAAPQTAQQASKRPGG
jgi:hypothetical protein